MTQNPTRSLRRARVIYYAQNVVRFARGGAIDEDTIEELVYLCDDLTEEGLDLFSAEEIAALQPMCASFGGIGAGGLADLDVSGWQDKRRRDSHLFERLSLLASQFLVVARSTGTFRVSLIECDLSSIQRDAVVRSAIMLFKHPRVVADSVPWTRLSRTDKALLRTVAEVRRRARPGLRRVLLPDAHSVPDEIVCRLASLSTPFEVLGDLELLVAFNPSPRDPPATRLSGGICRSTFEEMNRRLADQGLQTLSDALEPWGEIRAGL